MNRYSFYNARDYQVQEACAVDMAVSLTLGVTVQEELSELTLISALS